MKGLYPYNKKHFMSLRRFGKKILKICARQDLSPVLYGSYMIFHYTQDHSLEVHDLDFYVKEKDFPVLIDIMRRHKIKYDYSAKWHTLQIFYRGLKIEFDDIDSWYSGRRTFKYIDFAGMKVRALSLPSLRQAYKRAAKRSQDDPQKYLKKYELLKNIK
jgi:hypothetical protein